MAIDQKYGKVTLENSTIGDTEPVVVFRAKDKLLPKLLSYYVLFCLKEKSNKEHIDLVISTKDLVEKWQEQHGSKTPDTHLKENNGYL